MTREEKDLLLRDLCARLPYGVQLTDGVDTYRLTSPFLYRYVEMGLKPYLRSMLSMTDEEVNEYNQCWEKDRDDIMIIGKHFEEIYKSKKLTLYMHPVVPMYKHILWLLEHHFDFMGLIPKGLAIEATIK